MKATDVQELTEIREMIQQTERIVSSLELLLPPKGKDWLLWRTKGIRRRLDIAKDELRTLTDQLQVMMLPAVPPVIEKVVEPKTGHRKG